MHNVRRACPVLRIRPNVIPLVRRLLLDRSPEPGADSNFETTVQRKSCPHASITHAIRIHSQHSASNLTTVYINFANPSEDITNTP